MASTLNTNLITPQEAIDAILKSHETQSTASEIDSLQPRLSTLEEQSTSGISFHVDGQDTWANVSAIVSPTNSEAYQLTEVTNAPTRADASAALVGDIVSYDGTNWVNLGAIQGAKGDTGPQGPAGADGVDGAKGDTGAQGPAGADGVDGAKGDTGAQGPAGADAILPANNVISNITGLTGATEIINMVGVTETAYNALSTAQQQNGTLYIKTGA